MVKFDSLKNRLLIIPALGVCGHLAAAQQPVVLTLDQCREAAVASSPLTTQQQLAGQKWEMKNKAAGSSLLPQLEVNARGTYQNEVPALPDGTPFSGMIDLPLAQWGATLDLNQVIYGGSAVRNTRKFNTAAGEVENLGLDVQLDRLRDRVNSTYLGLLITRRQAEVNALMLATLDENRRAVDAQVVQGTATGAAQAAIAVRRAELLQQQADLTGTCDKLFEALRGLTGLDIPPSVQLEVPSVPQTGTAASASQRTELKLYDSQRTQLDRQNRLLNSRSNPQLSLFARAGYAQPGYNFLNADPAPTAIAGLNLRVPLTGWDATKKEQRANLAASRMVDEQQRDFERNNAIEVDQWATEIRKMEEVIRYDTEIVASRADLRRRAFVQMQQGVITPSQYITEFNNELQARLGEQLNRLRLVQAAIQYRAAQGIY